MSQRYRLHKLAEDLTTVGVSGGDMQAKLAQIVESHDLSAPEISRVVEKANRDVQLALYKVAEDKRFSFKLAQAGPALELARKVASATQHAEATDQDKLAAAIDEVGGDPFAAPIDARDHAFYPDQSRLSLFEVPLDAKFAADQQAHKTREYLLSLDHKRAELESLVKEARAAEVETYAKGSDALKDTVQAALDMIGSGVKLPGLAGALYAAVSGSKAGPDAGKHVDALLSLIVSGLKERGVPNHRLGFHWDADIDAIEELSVEDVVALAKRAAGIQCGSDITMQTQKRAQRYIEMVPDVKSMKPSGQHPFQDAQDYLGARPSVSQFGVPKTYLDEKHVDNLPDGGPKVVNGDSEFVIGIRDLIGAQDRKLRLHGAQEYLGLKIKQIEHTMGKLQDAQEKAAAVPLIAAGAKALGNVVGAASVMGSSNRSAPSKLTSNKPEQAEGGPAKSSSPVYIRQELEELLASDRIGKLASIAGGLVNLAKKHPMEAMQVGGAVMNRLKSKPPQPPKQPEPEAAV